MTDLSELESTAQAFWQALKQATNGASEAQVSMYAVGETIGLDREASANAAEELIALGLVEIRTLAGGVGLSQAGVEALSEVQDQSGGAPRLGTASPLEASRCHLVDQVLTGIKIDLGRSGLPYEIIAEITADIRTIEAQLASPKPKTTVVRECLQSLLAAARQNRHREWETRLNAFLR